MRLNREACCVRAGVGSVATLPRPAMNCPRRIHHLLSCIAGSLSRSRLNVWLGGEGHPTSAADIVEAIKTINLIRSASQMLRREVLARVVLTGIQPGTNIAEHIEKEVAKAGLPVMATKLHRLVAFQEMSFTGIAPTTGIAGTQATAFLGEIAGLGALPEPKRLAS
jgi:hypothetical protein